MQLSLSPIDSDGERSEPSPNDLNSPRRYIRSKSRKLQDATPERKTDPADKARSGKSRQKGMPSVQQRQMRPKGPRNAGRGATGAVARKSGTRQRSREKLVSESIKHSEEKELGDQDAKLEVDSPPDGGADGNAGNPVPGGGEPPPEPEPPVINHLTSNLPRLTEHTVLCVRLSTSSLTFVSPLLTLSSGMLWRMGWKKLAASCGLMAFITSKAVLRPLSNYVNAACLQRMNARLPVAQTVSNLNLAAILADRSRGPSQNAGHLWYARAMATSHSVFNALGIQPWKSVGIMYPTHHSNAEPSRVDYRAPHLRAGRAEPDQVLLTRMEHVNLVHSSLDAVLVCAEMAEQVATRVEMMPMDDVAKVAQVLSARIGNLMIPKPMFSQVVSGSALLASELATRSAVSRSCYATDDRSESFSSLAIASLATTPFFWKAESALAKFLFTPGFSLDQCVAVPLYEEMLKESARRMGVTKPGLAFGACEFLARHYINRGGWLASLPALALHLSSDYISHDQATAAHMALNAASQISGALFLPAATSLFGLGMLASIAAAWVVVSWITRRSKRKSEEPPLYAFGYRPEEDSVLPSQLAPHSAKVKIHPSFLVDQPRRPMQLSLGPVVHGIAPPTPDRSHGPTVLRGCLKRFCSNPPTPDKGLLRELRVFCWKYVRKNFVPLRPDHDLSFETWIAGTSYPSYRKEELAKVHREMAGQLSKKDLELKGFAKNETYMNFKEARGINSRSDQYKVWVGPAFAAIEQVVYEHPAFIKHVPVPERPAYIINMLGGYPGPFYETDYTAFERHFTKHVMEALEFVLYKHMLQNFPRLLDDILPVLAGTNTIHYKHFRLRIAARRMSGEMCTSLGNGFSNLVLAEFVAYKQGMSIVGVVEGDDGLFYTRAKLSETLFEQLGFTIKILSFPSLLRTSFCGLKMADDLTMLSDPCKVLANFGWTHSPQMWGGFRVRRELLRAKALSLLYERPNCPILSALALRVIEITGGYAARFGESWYERWQHSAVLSQQQQTLLKASQGPSLVARRDFEEIYGVPVQIQLQCESYLKTIGFGPMQHWTLDFLFSTEDSEPLERYWQYYVRDNQIAY